MISNQIDECFLLYRRQFILSRSHLSLPEFWKHLTIQDLFHLYVHPDLNLSIATVNGRTIILLGYILDYQNEHKTDQEIIEEIIEDIDSFDSLIKKIKRHAGQYVLIYFDENEFKIFHDPLGLREIYYCNKKNRVICGSQPNIIIKYSEPEIQPTKNPEKKRFYIEDMKKVREGRLWVGDETYFDEISHLLPNHFIDVYKMQSFRYWPNEKIKRLDLNEVVDQACAYLKGILRSASNRYNLMMAITAGHDTRTLLASSREISGKIYYFINKHKDMGEKHPDILISKAIFNKIKLPFHVHEVDEEYVPELFRKLLYENIFLASEKYLPVIYNVYFRKHSDKMNVLGVGEIGRSFFGKRPKKLDGYFLSRALKFKNSLYVVKQCQAWLEKANPAAEHFGVDIMTLLLWEQLLGNWGTVADSETDIAIEHFDPFNSHYLYEVLLGVDKKYASSYLFKEMIKKMWPELLGFPINPPKNRYEYIKSFLQKFGLFDYLRNILYKCEYFLYKIRNNKME